MKKEIELGLLAGISVGFENVESVYVPVEFLHKVDVRGIKVNKYYDNNYTGESSMRELTVSDYVDITVKEYGDTEEILRESSLFSTYGDEYNGYMRLYRSQDITSIQYIFKDGTMEDIYVDYSDEDMYYDPNNYQVNTPIISKDVPNGVNVRIVNPKNLHKYDVSSEVASLTKG